VLATGEAQHYRLEHRATPDGDAWDLVTRLPLRDREHRVVGVVVVVRDVTVQKRAEERIQDDVRRRDQFLAMLSHELRNPLGAIVTATSMLRTGRIDGMAPSRLVDILDRQSHQMAQLLDDLLEASRVTQNKIELRRRVVDLRAVVREAADAVRAQMDDRGVHFAVELSGEPIHVEGDPARLQQIQVNLLSNAAKYTPPGGHVTLSLGAEGDAAAIRVRDDGAGIPRDMLDSVFEPFVQATRTLDRSAGGLGLGLTLVRSLAAMHDGTVSVHSDGEGRGSEFVVRLPLTRRRPPAEPDRLAHASPPPGGTRVLVVEDNSDSRELVCALLAQAGFDCRAVDSGLAALAVLDDFRPDVAILDLGLPAMDGLELARRIRAHPEHARMILIALTGYGRSGDRAAARAAGFDEHVVKPVQGEQLVALLASLRGARQSG
jgi:two-component system CheB/CheR fusion protein